jgi:hypothetical protein
MKRPVLVMILWLAVGHCAPGQIQADHSRAEDESHLKPATMGSTALACREPAPSSPSSTPGKYCDGNTPQIVGSSVDINRECKALYGQNANGGMVKQDAYGWVCKRPGLPDIGLDMEKACHDEYSGSIAALVGIALDDWRCVRPSDVKGHVVPVLLLPVEKLDIANKDFVLTALKDIQVLMDGVRQFYQDRTGALVRGTNAFVVLTRTSAQDWECLALSTDNVYPECNYSTQFNHVDRFGLHTRVKQELEAAGWGVITANSSARIGGFPSLGPEPFEIPTWCGAGADEGGRYFTQAPSSSYASCTSTTTNPPVYENAFYSSGHEFGHTMGLPHTDDPSYQFNDLLSLPSNYQESVMYTGNGTGSLFFPFEVSRVLPFLHFWH